MKCLVNFLSNFEKRERNENHFTTITLPEIFGDFLLLSVSIVKERLLDALLIITSQYSR